MCDHKRYTYDTKEQTGYCHDCGAEGTLVFVVGGRKRIEQLETALSEACDEVEALAGRDNSCDPPPYEELNEWRSLVPNK